MGLLQIDDIFNNKMGATNSRNPKEHKIRHQRFQDANIIANDEIEITVRTTLDDYNTWRSNLKKISFANKENILFPLNHSFHQEGWCSENTGLIKITYDNYPFVFEQELQNRISLERHLSEEEMWYLLYTLVSTAKDFSLINRKVGDIRPHNIFVNDAGQIKLGVCFSWPNEPSNLQKTMSDKQITYLSPEEMEICKNGKMQTLVNSIVSESFSIGLTMLHAGLLFNFQTLYNIERFEINRKLLDEKIQNWMEMEFYDENNSKTTYSSTLREIVRNLCSYDHLTREKSTQIFNLLQPHREAILNIQPFEIKYGSPNNSQPHMQLVNNPLEKSLGMPIYNYAELSRKIPSTQTPISFNPNYDWSTRTFTQVPVHRNPQGNPQNNYQFQLFDRYANSAHSPQKPADLSIRLTNTISQRQTPETKPLYYAQTSTKPGTITVKPFMSIDEQVQQTSVFRPLSVGPLERFVEKKVESNQYLQMGPTIQQQQVQFNRVHVETVTTTNYASSDFLKRIDEQIQKSKNMFPS